ncbi:5726_t:CDS:2 [Gigaspora margarita]|uniref:5726_t:CDS:1 n=1 Tax=Gigaspora margarita TaxID=4874 RepID=A0ABN7VFE9_GIGMA|nr:5726_t:CDS:2 [Gigaspora margarita]
MVEFPKPPNAFIIYRKLFAETARTSGYNLPMNIISSMASQSWEQESNELLIIGIPKIKVEKKRNQWKTVSFDKPSTHWTNFFNSQNVYPSPELSTIYSDYSPIMIEEFEFDLGF